MQGQAPVIDYLKELLRGELAARDQYFLHSRMYADWGFTKLYERINHEMEEETSMLMHCCSASSFSKAPRT